MSEPRRRRQLQAPGAAALWDELDKLDLAEQEAAAQHEAGPQGTAVVAAVATGGAADVDPATQPLAAPAASGRRSVLVGVGIGLATALAAIGVAFSIIAIPMYALASFEPGSGINRDLVRTGLLKVALPFGLVVGLAVGITVGIWKARGGHLPTDRTPLHQ